MTATPETALPRNTYMLPGKPPVGAGNKLSNLQRLAVLSAELPYSVPPAHVLDGEHFFSALEAACPGVLPALRPETLDPELASRVRQLLLVQPLPTNTARALRAIYNAFLEGGDARLCVRSCFELEDRERQSFAGAFETVPGVTSFEALCSAVQVVYASVFSERALDELHNAALDSFPPMSVAIQTMLGGEGWLGGVAHTQAPDLVPHPLMLISVGRDSATVTSGGSIPEDYLLHRSNIRDSERAIVVQRQPGTATSTQFALNEASLRAIGDTLLELEERFEAPLEVEWLLDPDQNLHLLQARSAPLSIGDTRSPWPTTGDEPRATGLPVGHGSATGRVWRARTVDEANAAPADRILVTDNTDPEWVPAIRRARGVVTRIGARTSHVARTARESGVLAVVGCGDAIDALTTDSTATIICAEGLLGAVYDGVVETGHTLTPADTVSITQVSEAFSIARSYVPKCVHIELGPVLAAYRLPATLVDRQELPPRIQRRIAGYVSVDDFVHNKMLEAICLVAVAFPDATLVASLPDDSPWRRALPAVTAAARRLFSIDIRPQ